MSGPALAEAPSHDAGRVAAMVDDGEIVVLVVRPSLWFVALTTLPWVPGAAVVTGGLAIVSSDPLIPWNVASSVLAGLAILLARGSIQLLDWSRRVYILTDRRLISRARVPMQVSQMPLREVARLEVSAPRVDRFLGVGMVCCWEHSSTGKPAMYWRCVRDAEEVRRVILATLNRHHR